MELGILLLADKSVEDVIDRYQLAMKSIAPDYIWLPDRLLDDDLDEFRKYIGDESKQKPIELLDPFLTLAALASTHDRPKRFGIAVTDFVRRSPPDLARASFTLNQILDGSLAMGFGAGELVNLQPLGYKRSEKPVAQFEADISIYKLINDMGRLNSATGKSLEIGYNAPRAEIWVGGQRKRMLGITAQYADGWIPAWKMMPSEYREKVALITKLAGNAGRQSPKLGLFASVVLGDSKKKVLNHFKKNIFSKAVALRAAAEVWKRWGMEHPVATDAKGIFDVVLTGSSPELLHKALTQIPVEIINDVLFIGSVEEVAEELFFYKKNGMQHLALMFPRYADGGIPYQMCDYLGDFTKLCEEIKSW